jgi:hypothetical protein
MTEQFPPSNPNYDQQFAAPASAELLAGLTASHEAVRNKRLELLFAPITAREEITDSRSVEDFDYGHLFEQDEQTAEELRIKAAGATALRNVQYEQAPSVSTEMKESALERLGEARRDRAVAAILAKFEGVTQTSHGKYATVDAIRGNGELRYELGSYYLRDKLPHMMQRLPSQVAKNARKVPSHKGYNHIPDLRSQEYSAMLVLAMLDGTFEDPGADTIKENASGAVELGQHKAAANMLITS